MTKIRRLLLIIITFAILGGAAALYDWIAGSDSTPKSPLGQSLSRPPVDIEQIKRIGPAQSTMQSGQELELIQRGPKGVIVREYYAASFSLKTEDLAALKEVKLIWHLSRDQILTLTSDAGEVHIERGPLGQMQLTNGWLTGNVRIELQKDRQERASRSGAESIIPRNLVMTTDRVGFDIRSCKLYTEESVDLRGQDLEVHGTGMVLRWREITRQIDRLIIKHGEELIWRGARQDTSAGMVLRHENENRPHEQPRPSTDPAAPELIHSYMASFQDNVRVTYMDQGRGQVLKLKNVDRLNVLFDLPFSKEKGPDRAAASDTDSAGEFAKAPDGPEDMSVRPLLRLTWRGELNVVPTEQIPQRSGDQQRFGAEATGTPVQFSSAEMSGSCGKLQVKRNIQPIRHRSTQEILLLSEGDIPVHMETSKGDAIDCDQVHFDWDTGLGRFIGRGILVTAKPQRPDGNGGPIELSWKERATLHFLEQSAQRKSSGSRDLAGDFYLEDAVAVGGVKMIARNLTAEAGRLHVKLGPPGSDGSDKGQAIKQFDAGEGFSSQLPQENANLSIWSQSMKAEFTDRSIGKGQFLSAIQLQGRVLAELPRAAQQGRDTLTCDQLRVEMLEDKDIAEFQAESGMATYGNSIVSLLVATGSVIGRNEVDGQVRSSFSANKLTRKEFSEQVPNDSLPGGETTKKSTKITTLYGEPAELRKGDDKLTSTEIIITETEKDENRVLVLTTPVAGEMRASFQPADEGSLPSALALEWPGSMAFDGQTDKATFTGLGREKVTGAVLHSPTLSSRLETDKLELFFRPRPESKTKQLINSAEDLISPEPFFKPTTGRTLKKMVLTGSAQVGTTEHPDNEPGRRLRGALLKADLLTYDPPAALFYTNGPGSLLLEDYRPTETTVSAEKSTQPSAVSPPNRPQGRLLQRVGPGQTAFSWETSGQYDQKEHTAVLTGNVHMGSMGYGISLPGRPPSLPQSPADNRRRTDLWCQTFTITFASSPTSDGGPAEQSQPFPDLSAMDELHIRKVSAVGEASLLSADVTIQGQDITYNPEEGRINIKGSRRSPANLTYVDPQNGRWAHWQGRTVTYDTNNHQGSAPGGRLQYLDD